MVLNAVPVPSYCSVPVVSPSNSLQIERASSLRYFADGPKRRLLRHSKSSSACSHLPRRTFQSRSRSISLQTRALSAVTADSDSSNGDGVGSSNHAMNLSSVWSSPDVLRPFMVSSLHGFQEGLRSLKERGIQSSKEGIGQVYSRLTTADGKSLSVNDRWSGFVLQGTRTWQSQEPWTKWPIAIFAAAFLVVLVSCGLTVAQDLIPLWILGPLIAGSIIRGAYLVADLTQRGFSSTQPFREAVSRGALQVWEDAKKGELLDKIRATIERKHLELKQEAAKKRADLVLYVKSGEAATDFKALLLLVFSHLNDWRTVIYEDFTDWVRPYWRAFVRLMKRLF